MESLEEKLVDMSVYDFCYFLMDHKNNKNKMQRLQKFFDAGIDRYCDLMSNEDNITETMKRVEEKFLNRNLYDFYESLQDWKKMPDNERFILQTELYGSIVSSSIGIITNILVVATLYVSWKFWRHSIAILLLTLACVDIIGNGVCFVYFLPYALKPISKMKLPRIFDYLYKGFNRLSYMMMIPIGANRYVLICKPFTHRTITSRKSTIIQITTLTVFVATTGIYEVLYPKHMTQFIYNVFDLTFYGIMSFVLPLIISFVLTLLVIREFRRMNRTLEDSAIAGASSRQGERNMTRAMIATNVAFVVLSFPALVINIIYFFMCSYGSGCHVAFIWIMLIADINYYINIFIYTLYLPKFRSTFFGFFKCNCCKKRGNESISMSSM